MIIRYEKDVGTTDEGQPIIRVIEIKVPDEEDCGCLVNCQPLPRKTRTGE